MKINKQLFEDILSGKLKGTFVLRNGETYYSDALNRNYNKFRFTHPYIIAYGSYTPKGTFPIHNTSSLDIIDFMPETDMKENELTIKIPNNKVVDWDESKKQNKIVLKNKQLTYEDICKELFKDGMYCINKEGEICQCSVARITDSNNSATSCQLECILAKNKLTNVAKYLNDGWRPAYDNGYAMSFVIEINETKFIKIRQYNDIISISGQIVFKAKELAQQAIEILGEKTIKLALEPLGI